MLVTASRIAVVFALLSAVLAAPIPDARQSATITIINKSKQDICHGTEDSFGSIPGAKKCPSGQMGHFVKSGQTLVLKPSPGWIGAVTAWISKIRGSRLEFAFLNNGVFYDVTHELGMSDSTLGPADNRPRILGGKKLSPVAGEKNCVAKANSVWVTISKAEKQELLKHSKYLKQDARGMLTYVGLDSNAPMIVRKFFQQTVRFNAYEDPGSVAGKVSNELARAADMQTFYTSAKHMVIIDY